MIVNRSEVSQSEEAALTWARQHFPFAEPADIRRQPWGTTYRLEQGDSVAYLKILPAPLKAAARTTPRIGERFSGNVPEAIASDEQQGFLLLKDHQGQDLPRKPDQDERRKMLNTYATIQSQAAQDQALLAGHSRVVLDDVLPRLLQFLNPDTAADRLPFGQVNIDHFVGDRHARRYHALFEKYQGMLAEHLAIASELPDTLNHMDLRPSNAAVDRNGQCILYDWEESLVGPAGMSLHHMFPNALTPIAWLAGSEDYLNADDDRSAQVLLAEYIESLIAGGYADAVQLKRCLGSSLTVGLIQYITGFSCYAIEDEQLRETVADNLRNALSELLDICDYLAVQNDHPQLDKWVRDYHSQGREARAADITRHRLFRDPWHPAALRERGRRLIAEGRYRSAMEALQRAVSVTPDDGDLLRELAEACTAYGDFTAALQWLEQGRRFKSDCRQTAILHEHVTSLYQAREQAGRTGTVPKVAFVDEERSSGTPRIGKIELCTDLFLKYGTLQMDNVISADLLNTCHTAFLEKYDRYLADRRHKDALQIGDRRFQVTISMQAPFDDPSISANPLLLALLERILGDNLTIGAYTASASLPGAETQRVHKDHKALFPEFPDSENLPSFAVSLMIPLIDVDERVGTTRVRKGTHRLTSADSENQPSQSPLVQRGSVYLMDYRLTHYGQANRSQVARPIMNIVYQRPWFRDFMNFKRQPPVRIARDHFASLSQRQQALLAWTQNPSPTDPE